MISQFWIGTVLVLLLCATAVSLWLDAREQRMDRQLTTALPASHPASLVSIRRHQAGSRMMLFHSLANYKPRITYSWHPAYVVLAGFLAAAAVFYANHLFGFSAPTVAIAAGLVALMVVRGLFGWQQSRLTNQLFRQLPDAIQLVTSIVRSGLPVSEALRAVAREMPQPISGQFAIVCSELGLGIPADEAMEGVYRRTQVPEFAMFAVTLAVQLKTGGSLAETLQILADTVTQRVALAARAKALAGEVIFSSRALTAAPFIIGGLLYLAAPRSIDMLFYDPLGNKLLAYAIGSVLFGHFFIRWMIRRETAI